MKTWSYWLRTTDQMHQYSELSTEETGGTAVLMEKSVFVILKEVRHILKAYPPKHKRPVRCPGSSSTDMQTCRLSPSGRDSDWPWWAHPPRSRSPHGQRVWRCHGPESCPALWHVSQTSMAHAVCGLTPVKHWVLCTGVTCENAHCTFPALWVTVEFPKKKSSATYKSIRTKEHSQIFHVTCCGNSAHPLTRCLAVSCPRWD